ncbi:MAG TPA: sugar transferase [Acidimicrobiales bacterium]|nr:sugar transferase [Acidimicrobiales bacterium]
MTELLVGAVSESAGDGAPHAGGAADPVGSRRWWRRFVIGLVIGDAVVAALSALAANLLRFQGLAATVGGTHLTYLALALLMAPAWVVTMLLCGVYEWRSLGNGSDEYRRILDAAFRFLAVVAIVAVAFRLSLARGMILIALPLATVLTVCSHYVGRQWLHHRRARGDCSHRVLVVGSERQVADLVRHFRSAPYAGFQVVGACLPGWRKELHVGGESIPVVGTPESVAVAMRAMQADTVAVTDHEALSNGALRRLGWQLERSGADLMVAPSVIEVAGPRISIRPVAGLPLLHVEEPTLTGVSRFLKSAVERVLAGALLLVLSPIMVLIGLAVRVSSRGPALFKQVRVGQGGRLFTVYKFRTMRQTAEAERAQLVAATTVDGLLFKLPNDPRCTRFGRFLRRYSIDELPQLWNVVRGDMSVVGPRPPLPSEVADYDDELRRRLLVKPGMTGLWQVSGRSDLSWKESIRLDLYYVENWSPSLDLVILAKTAVAVLRGAGAY